MGTFDEYCGSIGLVLFGGKRKGIARHREVERKKRERGRERKSE